MNILIELPSWIGDSIMTTPAIENIISHFQNANITVIGPYSVVQLFKSHPLIHKTYVLKKKYLHLFNALRQLGNFDLYISFRGSSRAKIFKFFISAKKKHQFEKGKYQKGHQVEQYCNFINDALKINSKPGKLLLYPLKKNKKNKKKYIGINPGAAFGNAKRWYPEKFAEVACSLSDKFDIIIFGGLSEIDIAKEIENNLVNNGIINYQNLAGLTDIQQLVLTISNLDLFITGDSGPMHIAAAFEIPTVSIFGPTNVNETAQWMNKKSKVVKTELDCQPCMKRRCPLKHHNCMKNISALDVVKASNLIT